jgi:Tat protein secretion system quality control protein TatD with DNase activity
VIMDVGVRYVMPGYQHQLALTRHHLQLAAELQRPVSVHCVRCYGHLYDLFRCGSRLHAVLDVLVCVDLRPSRTLLPPEG